MNQVHKQEKNQNFANNKNRETFEYKQAREETELSLNTVKTCLYHKNNIFPRVLTMFSCITKVQKVLGKEMGQEQRNKKTLGNKN